MWTEVPPLHLALNVAYKLARDRFRKSLRQDKDRGLADCLSQVTSDMPAGELLRLLRPHKSSANKQFWGSRTLPHVLNSDGQPCTTPEELQDRWIQFFQQMEGGIRQKPSEFLKEWEAEQARLLQLPVDDALAQLPSLTQLEAAFRHVRSGKSTGLDGIHSELCHSFPAPVARQCYSQLVKLAAFGQESHVHKGGFLSLGLET